MPNTIRIDSHQHFWKLNRGDYDWLTEDLKPLYKDFMPEDLIPHLDKTGIKNTILVQAAPTITETQFLLELAHSSHIVAGVVGWVPFEDPQCEDMLIRFTEDPFFLGVRPMIQDINDPNWMHRLEIQPIYEKLINLNLCFDALVTPIHLPNIYSLLCRYPDLKLVIDHGGKPDIANNNFLPWADHIKTISQDTNAYCKLSGLLTESGDNPSYEQVLPYMQHLFECFGPERLMWGSDWPVLEIATDYMTWNEMVLRFTSDLNMRHQNLIFGDNARRFYGIH